MDFNDTVAALRALEGERVSAQVHGGDADASPLMMADGVLRAMTGGEALLEEAGIFEAEVATTFAIEGMQTWLSLWPSRFVDAVATSPTSVTITTRDGVLSVYRNRPGIDERAAARSAGPVCGKVP